MTVITPPPVVDAHGNISVHGRAGLRLELAFTNAAGGALDVSASTLAFECGPLAVALGAGATSDQRVLALTQEQIAALGVKSAPFAIIDRTGGTPNTLWAGYFRVYGWV